MLGWLVRGAWYLGLAFALWLLAIWPPPSWYRTHLPRETAFMALRRLSDDAERAYRPVPLAAISPAIQRAVMIGEDHRFYEHHGIDWIAMRRAVGYPRDLFAWESARDRTQLLRALSRSLRHPGRIRGASTITQQLAKNLYLSPSRNPFRKLKEAVIAYRLEAALGKDRILELYLNVAELGDNVWGVEAAARRYFGRSAATVNAVQAAALAGTLPHPRTSNPGYRPGRMRWRQRLILGRMEAPAVNPPVEAASPASDSSPDRPTPPAPGLPHAPVP